VVLSGSPVALQQARQQAEQQAKANAEAAKQQKAAEQQRIWQSQGLCRYCGGKLGVFGNKCKSCGRQN